MKKFTYMNESTFIGTILDENEYGYTIEFLDETVVKGFTDTIFLEKELTEIEEIQEKNTVRSYNGVTSIVDFEGRKHEGVAIEGTKYTYLVFKSYSQIKVLRFEWKQFKRDNEELGIKKGEYTLGTSYSWLINKETLKGSGGLSEKIMKVVKSLI